jgi:hypothetical protein
MHALSKRSRGDIPLPDNGSIAPLGATVTFVTRLQQDSRVAAGPTS